VRRPPLASQGGIASRATPRHEVSRGSARAKRSRASARRSADGNIRPLTGRQHTGGAAWRASWIALCDRGPNTISDQPQAKKGEPVSDERSEVVSGDFSLWLLRNVRRAGGTPRRIGYEIAQRSRFDPAEQKCPRPPRSPWCCRDSAQFRSRWRAEPVPVSRLMCSR